MSDDERRSRWNDRHRGGIIESPEPNAIDVVLVACR